MATSILASTSAAGAFSTSTSSFRASQSQSSAPQPISYSDDPLTQLPNVDFNFEDLRQRMAAFTTKFDAFIERGRKRVLEERNEFRGRLGELAEERRSTNTQISTFQSTLSTHSHVLSREASEKSDMHNQISRLESHHSAQMASRDRLKIAIAQTQRQIDAKMQVQREYAQKTDGQSRMNGPELNFWETYLGCRIEGCGDENKIKVVFVFPPGNRNAAMGSIRNAAEEREALFELKIPDLGPGGFEVVYTKPKLEPVKIERVVSKLNENKEIGCLLKGMRALFVEEMK